MFSFTPTTIKLYIVKVYIKSNFFFLLKCIWICTRAYWICPNLYRQKHHSYVGPIHRPNLQPIILLPMGDGYAAFRLASNLKTAWLGSTCQGYNPRQYSLQGHGGTQASPPWQGSNNRGGLFFGVFYFSFFNFLIQPGSSTPSLWLLVLAPPISVPGLFFA